MMTNLQFTDKFPIHEEVEDIFRKLTKMYDTINDLKKKNSSSIKSTKNREEILHLFYIRFYYDEFLSSLQNGIDSTTLMLEFMKLIEWVNQQRTLLLKEAESLKKNLGQMGNQFLMIHQKHKTLSLIHEIKDVELDHLEFSLFILDEYYFNKEKIENAIWNIAIGNDIEEVHRTLPLELLRVKWLCNQENDDLTKIKQYSEEYSDLNRTEKKLVINLCYVAKRYFECQNFKCSLFLIEKALSLMQENQWQDKKKYHFCNICKGLLLGKLKIFNIGSELLVDSCEAMRLKDGYKYKEDVLIGYELMNVGCVLTNWGIADIGIEILMFSVMYFEEHLPRTYDQWEETTILSARFYNDISEFKNSLLIAAPLFDYFHIMHFGSIKDSNKPVYELALEMSYGGKVRYVTKLLKYPLYLPNNIKVLLTEIIISFSGLGDRSSALIVENWVDRCKMLTNSFKTSVIDDFDYTWFPDIDKVIRKMRQNCKYHEKLFEDGKIDKRK